MKPNPVCPASPEGHKPPAGSAIRDRWSGAFKGTCEHCGAAIWFRHGNRLRPAAWVA